MVWDHSLAIGQQPKPASDNPGKNAPPPKAVPAAAKPADSAAAATNKPNSDRASAEKRDASHVAGLKSILRSLSTSFHQGQANDFANLFTDEGEFIDAKGVVFHGRKSIETEFAAVFKEYPKAKISFEIRSIRMIAPNVISAFCLTHFRKAVDAAPMPASCRIILSRDGEHWKIASMHESDELGEMTHQTSHHAQLSQLEWLIGDWVGEGHRSQVHFSCRWDEDGNYLIRDFEIRQTGSNEIKGTQRIGYDPTTEHLRVWTFDSAGGFSEGYFHRDGDSWIVRSSGTTAAGHVASSTTSLTLTDKHRITSETIDRFVNGEKISSTDKVTLVRKAERQVDAATAPEKETSEK
jgi:uncharacterized protein (TIGR02246 family)